MPSLLRTPHLTGALLCTMLLCTFTEARAQITAFPGAAGPAAASIGGRGGRIIEVTTLDDSGPGSLREALAVNEPRTIVFRVAGTIELDSTLLIRQPRITIAGQTSPGGILLRGNGRSNLLDIRTHDVVVRYLRFRNDRGEPGTTDDIYMGSGAKDVVLDHLSLSWANDELMSIWPTGTESVSNVTISWNLFAEALKGHATAILIGTNGDPTLITGITLHHNVMSQNTHRNPLLKCGSATVAHNMVYNYSLWGVGLGGGIQADVHDNLFIAGPETTRRADNIILHRINPNNNPAIGPGGDPSIYVSGNMGPGCDAATDSWSCVQQTNPWDLTGEPMPPGSHRTMPIPQEFPIAPKVPTSQLERLLLEQAGAHSYLDATGAWVEARDAVDVRVIKEIRERGGVHVNEPSEVGGFPNIQGVEPYTDDDHDGMADVWETMHGFDSSDPLDGVEDADADGWTNVEEFLNGTPPHPEPEPTPDMGGPMEEDPTPDMSPSMPDMGTSPQEDMAPTITPDMSPNDMQTRDITMDSGTSTPPATDKGCASTGHTSPISPSVWLLILCGLLGMTRRSPRSCTSHGADQRE